MLQVTDRAGKALILLVFIAGFFTGCMRGPASPASRPARKKMLTGNGLNGGWEAYGFTSPGAAQSPSGAAAYPPLPFSLADTAMTLGSETAYFYIVRIPSTNLDFLLPLAKTYEPYLSSWLTIWPQTGRRGVAIDLS